MSRPALTWQIGFTADPASSPNRSVPAQVPGAVQLDWARAEGWPPYWYADNFRQYAWMADTHWIYRADLPRVPLAADERLYFVSRGVDYECEVRVNGVPRHRQAGMHTPFELDFTGDAATGGTLEIVIFPAPAGQSQPLTERRPRTDCKPPAAYGWDFHPRLIPLGIWDETHLEVRPATHLRRAELFYTLAPDFSSVDLRLEADVAGQGRVRWQLSDDAGNVAVRADNTFTARLDRPRLWWPNGEGEPVLYRLQAELLDDRGRVLDTKESRVGFRRVRLVMLEDGWDGGQAPVTQAAPPTTFEVNGRRIFAKGSNWAPPNIFPGIVTAETYRPLLQMAKDAHMNLLRCWGGGFVNKDSFFGLCDQLGIMVWQEFTRACNQYADTPAYLALLDQESRAIITRLRRHPSLALWCGGNELFNSWSRNTEQDLHMRLVARNCFDLDPSRPYIHTSPIMGIGHGGYWFEASSWSGSNVFLLYPQATRTAYCEFGVPGTPSAAALRRFIPAEELFPPRRGTQWQTHFAFDAWDGDKDSWLMPAILAKYLGAPTDLDDLVRKSQLLQSVGYRAIFEEARRQKPRAAMALNWCFNEPWPCAANNSLVAWPAEPKPALAAVAASLRPVLASARVPRFDWRQADWFEAELWLLNDSPAPLPAGRMEAVLKIGAHELPLLTWEFPAAPANQNLRGPTCRVQLPALDAPTMTLVLRVAGHPPWDSEYIFCRQPSPGK
jgi:beta-mannosidase